MSSLIVMPGSEEFKKTLASIAKAPSRRKLVQPVDLVGHTLMLNTALVKTFQCGGFVLGPNRPIGIVDEQSQQIPIRKALEEKKLIDVTGKDMATKGFKGTGGQTSAITEEDTGKKVFVGRDRRGNLYIATPRSKTEAKRFEREIRTTGTLKSVDFETETIGLGSITEEVIESSEQPVKTPAKKSAKPTKKVKKNVRTRRTSGNAVRSRNRCGSWPGDHRRFRPGARHLDAER
jgi:hypothetical protein